LRGIASGMGVSYNSLAGDLEGANYSSLRQGALEDRDYWKTLQQWFIDHFMYPIYEAWLECAILSGALAPLKASNAEKYKSVNFYPRR